MAEQQKQSKYAGVSKARAQRAANYFRSGGHLLLRIGKVEEGEDKNKIGLVAANGSVVFAYEDHDEVANKVGEEVSEVIKRSNVAFEGRLKALAMAVGNLTEADFDVQEYDGEIFDELMDQDVQPAAGVILEVRAVKVKKQSANNKTDDQLISSDFYTRVDFIRRVGFTEARGIMLAGGVDESDVERLIPGIAAEIVAEAAE